MKKKNTSKLNLTERRALRVRKHLRGTSEKPRMCVYRSSRYIYVQLIDDENGKTLASSSSLAKSLREEITGRSNMEQARLVGIEIAQKAKDASIARVIFDRGACKFHGRIKELAHAARENGLSF